MSDADKTKAQLIRELEEARQRITELQADEEAIRQHAEERLKRYESIVNVSRDFMSLIAKKGYMYVAINESYCKAHDRTREELIGRSVMEVWGEEAFATKIKPYLDGCFAGNEVHYEAFFAFPSLGERYFDVAYYPYTAHDGTITHAVVVSRDITDRKHAEEALKESVGKLRRTLGGTVHVLASTVERRDPYTAGHQQRVAQLAMAIAREMGLPEEFREGIYMAGIVHDVGKIAIPAEILARPGRLNDLEFGLVRMHALVGSDILKDVEFPWPIARIVGQHHERIDGSGYPQGLSDEQILLAAKILGLADVVEAMASHRPYRPALGIERALEEISKNRGKFYDPDIVDVCLKLFTEKGFQWD